MPEEERETSSNTSTSTSSTPATPVVEQSEEGEDYVEVEVYVEEKVYVEEEVYVEEVYVEEDAPLSYEESLIQLTINYLGTRGDLLRGDDEIPFLIISLIEKGDTVLRRGALGVDLEIRSNQVEKLVKLDVPEAVEWLYAPFREQCEALEQACKSLRNLMANPFYSFDDEDKPKHVLELLERYVEYNDANDAVHQAGATLDQFIYSNVDEAIIRERAPHLYE